MHAVARAGGAALDDLPVKLRSTWNPATCPAELLPYLAIAFSVDRWSTDWDEAAQRAVIAASWDVHCKKGTVGSIRRMLESFGYSPQITEWWQTEPPGQRGTFEITVGVLDVGITPELYTEIERLINSSRPLARHLTNLLIQIEPLATFYSAAATGCVDTLTVFPGD